MRKIIESTLMSVDGVVGNPAAWGVMDYRDGEVQQEALQRLSGCDAMLMGRRTYEVFAEVWPPQTNDLADRVNSIRKFVFSSTLEKADWNNTRVIKELTKEEILKLKQEPGKNMMIFGSGTLIEQLTNLGLIDEYQLMVNPVILGKGKPLFKGIKDRIHLKLADTKTFKNGVVLLQYQPGKE